MWRNPVHRYVFTPLPPQIKHRNISLKSTWELHACIFNHNIFNHNKTNQITLLLNMNKFYKANIEKRHFLFSQPPSDNCHYLSHNHFTNHKHFTVIIISKPSVGHSAKSRLHSSYDNTSIFSYFSFFIITPEMYGISLKQNTVLLNRLSNSKEFLFL